MTGPASKRDNNITVLHIIRQTAFGVFVRLCRLRRGLRNLPLIDSEKMLHRAYVRFMTACALIEDIGPVLVYRLDVRLVVTHVAKARLGPIEQTLVPGPVVVMAEQALPNSNRTVQITPRLRVIIVTFEAQIRHCRDEANLSRKGALRSFTMTLIAILSRLMRVPDLFNTVARLGRLRCAGAIVLFGHSLLTIGGRNTVEEER